MKWSCHHPAQKWLILGTWVSTSEIKLCVKLYFKIASHCWDIDTWSQTLLCIFFSALLPKFHTICHSFDNNCWSNLAQELSQKFQVDYFWVWGIQICYQNHWVISGKYSSFDWKLDVWIFNYSSHAETQMLITFYAKHETTQSFAKLEVYI